MKTTIDPLFSNGTEFMVWTGRNCDRCVKQSTYNESKDTYTAFRCAIDKDISAQAAGLSEVSLRSFQVVQNPVCPYLTTTRKATHRKRPVKGQMTLELPTG